jgi:hypothetical protein
MQSKDVSNALTYVSNKPDINVLKGAYDQTTNELEGYFDNCRNNYDDRRNFWPGKSRDLRKHGADAFPWEGASDMEAHTIDERITRLVSLFIASLNRANVRAYPVESSDTSRSKVVSSFLKWMTTSGYIPRFKQEMELGANYLLERGILITYVGWHREDRKFLQKLSLEQIALLDPVTAEMIMNEAETDMVVSQMQQAFNGLSTKRAKKAIKSLRKTGFAELPIVRRQIDCPNIKTLAPDGDFFFPTYVTDPQRAPYCFWRTYYTPQELENKVITDGWDADFVDYVIEHFRGVEIDSVEREQEGRRSISQNDDVYEAEELIELVHCYQRLIDEEDGSEGIYETIFHKSYTDGYAKFELLNGYEDYPVVVTKFSEDAKRLYDTTTVPDLLRGIQQQVKIERDSRIDRASIATLPPIMHPVGQTPTDWGPGRFIPYRRKDEIHFADAPDMEDVQASIEIERTLLEQANRIVGLDEDSQISGVRKQFLVNKFLQHTSEVLRMAYRCFQRFGPDNIFFRVTGVPDAQEFTKGDPDENFDIIINYDVLNTDPQTQEAKLKQMVDLMALDRNGRINVDNLLDVLAGSVDPILADAVMQPAEVAQDKVIKDVTDDLTKIHAGIEMPARPNGGQVALQLIQQYVQQPDIAQRLQTDQGFAARLEKYQQQYAFAQAQQINATQYGQYGTAAASVGDVQTQGMEQ